MEKNNFALKKKWNMKEKKNKKFSFKTYNSIKYLRRYHR
jgi:hypothetical protein